MLRIFNNRNPRWLLVSVLGALCIFAPTARSEDDLLVKPGLGAATLPATDLITKPTKVEHIRNETLVSDTPKHVGLIKPMGQLFSHNKHANTFDNLSIHCTQCHTFGVKANTSDPTDSGVDQSYLKPGRALCHQCHLRSLPLPVSNQCNLCHSNPDELAPNSHKVNWKFRHGSLAQMDRDACKECHTESKCLSCHGQRDGAKPQVHRANFRLFHSIEARANPQKCTTCHGTINMCVECHSGGTR